MDTGSFDLLTQRSAGPDGIVYVARDTGRSRTLDLRMLTGLMADAEQMAGLARRVRLLELVEHPCLLSCVESVLDSEAPYLATEPAPQDSLMGRGSQAFQAEPIEGLRLVEKLADGLSSAHRVGLVHGSLSPQSVFLGDHPKLDLFQIRDGLMGSVVSADKTLDAWQDSDFQAHLSRSDAVRTPASDVFSLGAILCWLLSGAAPQGAVVQRPVSNDDLAATRDSSDVADPDATIEKVAPFILENEPSIDWARSDQLRVIESMLRPLMCEMLSNDEFLRPTVHNVAKTLHGLVTMLAESVCGQTINSGPDFRATTELGPLDLSSQKPTQLGRFLIHEELGRGGMGTVYRGEDLADGQIVALKTLRRSIAAKLENRRRFIKEGRLLARINSPYVTRLIEANEDDGIAYLAIEFVDGSSVGKLLQEQDQLDERLALSIACDVVRALDVAHEHGIIHRDVKPDNILLSSSDGEFPRARLTDFGLARQVEQSASMEVTQAGALLGTPFYMAPEQWTGGKNVDPRTDIYSLGATLYRMLAGSPPFFGTDLAELMSQHLRDVPKPLQSQNPAVSDGFAAIIEKMLAKDPADRYADAADLLEALERLMRGEASSMVLHPLLPDLADEQRFMSWEFQWELDSTPAQLWPYVSNTDRFNRAMGLPPATFRTEPAPGIGVRRFGETKIGPIGMKWEEHPFEWIQGRRFGVLREFTNGPFIWFISITELSERPAGGALLKHSFRIEPRGLTGRLASKIQMGRQTRNSLDRLYRRIDRVTASQRSSSADRSEEVFEDVFEAAHRLKSSQRRRLDDRVGSMIEAGADIEVVDQLARFLLEAPDPEVSRMRPIALARRLGLDERLVIDCCLLAVKHGVLKLLWDILCPVCRVPSTVHETLQELKEHEHCEACNLDFEADFSESIELIFAVHPEIRSTKTGTYCVGGPANFPHVVAQTRIRPGERMKWALSLEAGQYRLRSPQLPHAVEIQVTDAVGERRWDVDLGGGPQPNPPVMAAGRQTFSLSHQLPHELLVRLERRAGRDDALTAAQASSLATFRSLFPNEVMAPGQLASVTRITLLAMEVGRLDAIYSEQGDSGTFAVVHECLQLADQAVNEARGAVIKMIGDGFLAAFEEPAGAIKVALELPARIAGSESTRGRPVRVAIHRGDAMMTTINGRLDYFGMTVNNVFELLNSAEFGDVLITQSVASDPVVADILRHNDRFSEVIRHQQVGPRREPVQRLSVLET